MGISYVTDDNFDWDAELDAYAGGRGAGRSSVSGPAPSSAGISSAPITMTGAVRAANDQNRLGVVWLFSKILVDEKPVWVEYAGGRARSNAVWAAPTSWQIASDTIGGLVRDLVNYIKEKLDAALKFFDDNAEEVTGVGAIAIMIAGVLEEVWPSWRDWVPVAGDAATGLMAIGQTFTAAKALFDTWLTSSCAPVVDGVPSVVVESLRSTMKRSLAEGLVTTIQSGLKVAGAFLTAGASSLGEKIVGVVAKIVIKVVTAILKHKERQRMRRFCAQASDYFAGKDGPDAIHKDHAKFVAWYKPVAIGAPAIAALTLLSHICGDKVAYLAMYQDRLETLTQSQFDNSVAALDALKPWARSYLDGCGFTFRSTDTIAGTLLRLPDTPPAEITTAGMTTSDVSAITTRSRSNAISGRR